MTHRVVNKLHFIEVKGRVNVYTEREYQHLTWWSKIKNKYFKQ
jgi:hypothetical protein